LPERVGGDCCVTSPPYYGLRNYGVDGQLGLENSPADYVAAMVAVFREVRRVLKDDGTLWLNLGDSYNAHPNQRKVTDKAGQKQATNRGAPNAPSRHVAECKPNPATDSMLSAYYYRVGRDAGVLVDHEDGTLVWSRRNRSKPTVFRCGVDEAKAEIERRVMVEML
jgi:hypothetical protein